MNISYIDYARSTCLCDAGLHDAAAAVCVAEDGRTDFVLIVGALIGDGHYGYDPATPQAPHEQTGPLPPAVAPAGAVGAAALRPAHQIRDILPGVRRTPRRGMWLASGTRRA